MPEGQAFAPPAAAQETQSLDGNVNVCKARGELENMHVAHKACVDWSKGVSLGIRASPWKALGKKEVSIE